MIDLTPEERRIMAQRVSFILSRSEEGRSWAETLSLAYCEFMPDQTPEQGDLMAGHILDTMSEFETMYDVAWTEPGAFVEYYLNEATEGKTLEQQCRSLYSLIEGIKAFDDSFGEKLMRDPRGGISTVEEMQENIRGKRYDGPVTEAARDALRVGAANLISETSLTDFALEHITALLKEYPDQAHRVFGYTCGDRVFRSLSAMVLYTMAKNRELKYVPETVSARQVTYAVCAEDAMRRLVSDAEKNYIDTLQFRARKKAIWQVLQVGIVAGLVLLGGGAVAAAIVEEQIVGAALAGFAAIYGIAVCIGPMDDTVQQLIENEYVPIDEDTIPVYSNAEEILSVYNRNRGTAYQAEPTLLQKTNWQETPDLLIEEL